MTKRKDKSRQSTHTTQFHGPVRGPVHTGSGDIRIGDLSYGVSEQGLAQLRDQLITALDAARYQVVTTVIERLQAERLQEVQEMATSLEQAQLAQQDAAQFLTTLRQALVEAQQRAVLPVPSSAPAMTDIVDAPDLDIVHKLKLTLPIIPFLLDYEGEVQLGSTINLEMAWEWLKRKLGR